MGLTRPVAGAVDRAVSAVRALLAARLQSVEVS
jgi:hypothetical protein